LYQEKYGNPGFRLKKTAKAKQKQDSFGFPRAAGPFRQIRLIAPLTGSR
jgi:hypothetical protein